MSHINGAADTNSNREGLTRKKLVYSPCLTLEEDVMNWVSAQKNMIVCSDLTRTKNVWQHLANDFTKKGSWGLMKANISFVWVIAALRRTETCNMSKLNFPMKGRLTGTSHTMKKSPPSFSCSLNYQNPFEAWPQLLLQAAAVTISQLVHRHSGGLIVPKVTPQTYLPHLPVTCRLLHIS